MGRSRQGRKGSRGSWGWQSAAAALAVIVTMLVAESIARGLGEAHPLRALAYLLVLGVVTLVAMQGGLRAGVTAAAAAGVYAVHFFEAFASNERMEVRLALGAIVGAFTLAIASLVGYLRTRGDRAVRALLREREARAELEGRRFGVGQLFEMVGEAIVVVDGDGRIVLWNPAAERIFGDAPDQAVGMDVARVVPRFHEVLRRGGVVETAALRRDGRPLAVEMTLSDVQDVPARAGRGPFTLAILRDVTERVRLTRDLQASNRALRDFTHVVAHDLRNPVRGINALLSFLERDAAADLAPAQREDLALVRRDAQRLSTLLESLLDYSRVTRFDPSDLHPTSVGRVLEDDVCRTRFETLVRERGAHLETPPADAPRVLANPGALSLVLGNLVANALAHNPRPEPLVRVRVRPAADGAVEVSVEDNGPGFSAESVARIQDSLVGQDSAKAMGRSGFGLVLVHRAVERMGGRVALGRSDLGGGRVSILLPAARDREGDDRAGAGMAKNEDRPRRDSSRRDPEA